MDKGQCILEISGSMIISSTKESREGVDLNTWLFPLFSIPSYYEGMK
jgi:hypothetical protein